MIIPSVDIEGGRAVQLVGGRDKALDGGDPLEVAERLAVAGELCVIDLDAALGRGDNRQIITELVRRYRCRVGGGVRSVDAALSWLDAGADRVILGTAASPEVLAQLPRERVIAALDALHGEVVVDGWRARSGASVEERIDALRPFVGGFLLTLVEHEGRLEGTDLERAAALTKRAAGVPVTIAGGVTTAAEVAVLDRIGADAQVGMALYTGRLALGDAIAAVLKSDRDDGLWPTVVCDRGGRALGLVYSNGESLRRAVDERVGVYWSRRRGLWRKGESSGNVQRLLRVDVDCDRDTLRFIVEQQGAGFCHLQTASCWGRDGGLATLEQRLRQRAADDDRSSYTRRLLDDEALLAAKLDEEADELAAARERRDVIWEAADVIYFTAVAMTRAGVTFSDVETELDRRARRVRRRPS